MKHYQHPNAGRLVFDFTVLEVMDEQLAPPRLVNCVPAPETGTGEKMQALLGTPAAPLPASLEVR